MSSESSFEIIITIGTPSGPIQKTCNATICGTLKGKNYWSKSLLLCDACPIRQIEKQHNKEINNCKERIDNILYCAWEENRVSDAVHKVFNDVRSKVERLFKEEPIKPLI